MKFENKHEDEIPEFLREAFGALRHIEEDPPNLTFGMIPFKVNDQKVWGIAVIELDDQGNVEVIMPIFQSLPPDAKVTIEDENGEDIQAIDISEYIERRKKPS